MSNYVSRIFSRNAAFPDKTAIVDRNGQRATSWAELYGKSCAVAAYAASLGLKGLIPVCMPRCVETVEVMLGLGLAGLGVAPLSERTPPERLSLIEEQTGNRAWTKQLYYEAVSRPVDSFTPVSFDDEDMAYVVFTSGSTGIPKGVVLSNATVEKSYVRMASSEFLELREGDTVLQNASFSFVALMIDLFAPLYMGCVTHILPEKARTDTELMTAYINEHGITSMFITPKPLCRLGDTPSLRVVCVGGETVSEIGPRGYRLLNVWGMSETAALALGYTITQPMDRTPIGKSRGDFRCYIVDADGKLSDEGELCLSGATASCYYKRPDLSAEVFVPNPFCNDEGHRVLMHTGDLVRRLKDGNLVYLNRRDFMIKINGQRVEPGEVESALTRVPGISAAAVKGFTEDDGHSYLCAYYVSEEISDGNIIREKLGRYLPSYMVPAFYVKMEALPLNSNGKLDRSALKAPDVSALRSEYEEASSYAELALCRGFEQVLKLERVGVNDDFICLGGDSIRAMSLVGIASLPGLSAELILSGRTPARIAELITPNADEPRFESGSDIDTVRLTDSQMGIYLACAAAPESVKYNIPYAIRFARRPGMTCRDVAKCVDSVLAVHPALLSRIAVNGEDVFLCRGEMPPEGICVAAEIDETAYERQWSDFIRPFNLESSPLCRSKVLLSESTVHILLDTHHIVSDGSSTAVLVKQLCRAIAGEAPEAEKVDAFALQGGLSRFYDKKAAKARAHFEALLGGVEADSNLLSDFSSDSTNPPAQRLELRIDGIDFSRLRLLGITESSFFMGVFGYTLAKMTGQKECLFAAAESGRKSSELDSTVSMMVKTLPVYMQIDEKRSAFEQLAAWQEQFFSSIENDALSFSELSAEFGVNADVMFVYQSDMLSDLDTPIGRINVELRPTGSAISNFNAAVFKEKNGHRVCLEYRSDLYERKTIERFGEIFRNASKAFAEDSSLEAISLSSDEDIACLDALNLTDSPCNFEETIVDSFRLHAKQRPDKLCVVCNDRRYSYAQADDISDRISCHVRRHGVKKGQTVAVLISRSEYMFLASMGVMKAGAVYMPLDPSYPSERLSFMVADASAKLVIAERGLISMLPDYAGEVLYTDEISGLPPADTLPAAPTAEDGFVLLYTSGTTGLPKGCLLMHRNLTAMVHAYSELTGMDGDCTACAYASYGFDAHTSDLYPIIAKGGTLAVIPDDIRLELGAVKEYCESNHATHLILTTQLCVQFVLQYRRVSYLRCLVAGGEKMVSVTPPESYTLMNCYGPTECTVLETGFTVDRVYDDIPIGKAIANTKLYVVDSANRRVPAGVPGELVLCGPQVARGYLNRPEQTAKAFVPNTFEPNPPSGYERCYRTGDIVRYLPDGNLVFIGRRDMQVKIRGFRIELTELEKVIRDFPGIKEVALVAREAAAGGKCLNAYITADTEIDIQKLNDYIRSVKPPYFVPAATMQLDRIPLTVNGKVDRRKLPEMEMHFEDTSKPENEMQQKVFDCVSRILGTDEFGINTDLFLAGLSSIGSIRLCSALAEEFGIPVQIRVLKKYSTVSKLEEFISRSLNSVESNDAAAAGSADAGVEYAPDHPISKTMEGIFTECIGRPDSTVYNVPYLVKLSPELDEERLKDAIVAAVEAHPYMKTELFTDREGRIRQHRRLNDSFSAGEIGTAEADCLDDIRNELVKPFSITDSRLFEFKLIHADGTYLFLNFHHIISDGTSINVFLSDVERAYAGDLLTPEGYSGFDVADDEKIARDSDELSEAGKYYENLLNGLDSDFLPLPDRYACLRPSSGKLVSVQKHSDPSVIRSFCDKNRVSMNAFFVSAFGLTLSRYAGLDYSVFNTVYSGRNDSRTLNTFAMLVKTLPVVLHADSESAGEIVKNTAAQLMDSMANDLYSYGEIVRSCEITSDIIFIYQGDGFKRESFCGKASTEIELCLSEAKAAIALQVMYVNGEFVCNLEYDPSRYTEKLMAALLDAFDMACAGLACGKSPREISLLSAESEAELEGYNDTAYEYDRSQTITSLFLDKVKRQPDKLCVAYKDIRLSFGEVGVLSGKLSRFLMEKGIGRDDVVAILINRNENMVITAHGVERAGAAYVGLDPTYPSERLEFMISDSGSKILIAERCLMDRVPGYRGEVLYTDEIYELPELGEAMEAEFGKDSRHLVTPENDALIIYSSGTTGVPKGSVLQHKAIICLYNTFICDMLLDDNSRVAQYASFGFDGGAMDVFSTPMVGGALFVIPDEMRMDMKELEQFYVRNGITTGFMTTQVGTMFISNTKCRTLKAFMVGGEKLIPVMPPENVRFMNGYGPSETMCYVNHHIVSDTAKLQPIGKTNGNIKEYIIDRFGNRLPFGACGELCISGGQMGRGYLNRPEKTAEVFVKNPFCNKDGYEKMYRTGDVVRMLPDGNYDFVGRRDGQVKIRGFRVELSEVEDRIRQFPGVVKTVVTAFDNPAGGKFLAAYVVSEGELDAEALKSFIASQKPDYMVPPSIMRLDDIPLTSNGKVDLKKLPKPELRNSRKGAEPADETEERICSIFGEVLGVEKVYADDDFFRIGGSSISAIQVLVKCEQAGMAVVYKDLFAHPTAAALAGFLGGGKREDIVASDLEKGDGHNYSALKYNVLENLPNIRNNGVGDVLLTGATGFLGSHVFRQLLESTDGRVIALVRSKAGLSALERLEMMTVYYFDDWFGPEFSNRVTVIDGDMEDEETVERLLELHIDTIINCAANVKHFAAGDELLGANFTGVENLISLAEKKNAKLIQISSLSVCGESVNGSVPAGYIFKETDLNIGQSLENKYIYTKYLAEQALIDAVSDKRIRGKVIRLGNLMARAEDSEFQVNAGTNGFLRMFIGFSALGCFPIGMMDAEIEFSPIDAVAKAVVLLAGTPDEFTVFHAKNCNKIQYGYFLNAIRSNTRGIEIVEDDVFEQRLNEALTDKRRVEKLGGLLAYRNETDSSLSDSIRFSDSGDENRKIRVKLGSDTTFTTKALYRLGFSWPLVSEEYLNRMVETLLEMNFFSED